MNRTTSLARLQNEMFDIVIIGAGASGAGCALDAVLRGYKVALIDKKDFASETSSRSTKLIHGGVRYLEQAFKKLDFAQLKQVRHGLEERHIVLKNAPHLARPLALMTPVSSWFEGLYFKIGLSLYDTFATNDTLPKSKWLNKKEVLEKIPTLDRQKLHSGVLYYDGQLDDARYCLALAQSASENGAAVANYVQVTGFGKDENGKLNAVNATDALNGDALTIRAKLVINCTGPFSDHVRLMANAALSERLRPSKGVHLSLPYSTLNSEYAMLIPKTSDGRVVFAIPFEGATMIGTTDTECDEIAREPTLNHKEREYLAATLNPYLAKPIDPAQIRAGFGGLRPLLATDPTKSTKSLVRDHEVEIDEQSGLISLLGGKWTTYRLMAKDTLDEADKVLGQSRECKTADYILAGGENYGAGSWQDLNAQFGLAADIARHLVSKYGSRAHQVASLVQEDAQLAERLSPAYPYIRAEVVFTVRNEMVVTPRDFLARRIRLEITDWDETLNSLPVVADLMAHELGWTEAEKTRYADAYASEIGQFMADAR
ncbi:glycerol-3-phosphate dehydrogenase/oxidase [Dyadobacter fermentans]|uniref:FAD dependent oxidoreductase n=1 Tax=Dyadobacter fermentans (strain ATCC 700827 / DSM 18053 / CIP 107007 / KCTC 52180 / NS114) TaxID=471854 RepID=C6VW96_DYAFD|nr:FAD-dependent oxidoreductase [Dyadobacter fermentans]ACT93228.1 FAD dependent oxidoreductase [Dyadobacter fermentans DSM 18053]